MHGTPRKRRLWLRLAIAGVALAVALTITWVLVRLEKILLSNLPPEIRAGDLAVSLLAQRFLFTEFSVLAWPDSACAGKELLSIRNLSGEFSLRERRLKSLTVDGLRLSPAGHSPTCWRSNSVQPVRLSFFAAEGLGIDIKDARFTLPEVGETQLVGRLDIKEEDNIVKANFAQIVLQNALFRGRAPKIELHIASTEKSRQLSFLRGSAAIKIPQLAKIRRLQTRRLSVDAGSADIALTANFAAGQWRIVANVELRNVRLSGEPFYRMPFGLLQLTPQNVWPMAEDAPGIFSFGFEVNAAQRDLRQKFAEAVREALLRKAKKNLRKKIPVLPF